MKRIFSAVLTTAMLAVFFSGCVCETADTVFEADGSGQVCARVGFSKAAADRLDLHEELDNEEFKEFSYQGKTYIGDEVTQEFSSAEEFNQLFNELDNKSESVSDSMDLGVLNLSRSSSGILTLTLVCDTSTGNENDISNALTEAFSNLTEKESKELLADMVLGYTFTFPAEVCQTSGGSRGVTIKGNCVQIDLLACESGTYRFTTAEKNSVCDKGRTCPLDLYADLTNDGWYHDGIHYCLENGMMKGTGTAEFSPAGTTTRGMVFTILARMDGAVINSSGNNWYADGTAWAAKSGISDGSLPKANITRAQLALMLYRYAQYKGYDTDERADITSFSDVVAVENWMLESMRWACGCGILNGSNGALKPDSSASRAEVATMLMRFCTKVAQ